MNANYKCFIIKIIIYTTDVLYKVKLPEYTRNHIVFIHTYKKTINK